MVGAMSALVLLAGGCAEPRPTTDDDPRVGAPSAPEPAATPPEDRAATPDSDAAGSGRSAGHRAVVAEVVDGDTIRLRDGRRIRLVQVDTPEVHGGAECGGRAASAALARQLPPGSVVRLTTDAATDRVDRYGRELRYVWSGGRNLNVWLVRRGHAAPYFYAGERGRYAAQLERAARRARTAGLGFWGACPNAVLDATRGVATGRPPGGAGSGGATGAESGAAQLQPGRAALPLAPAGGADLDCADLPGPVRVTPGDPHRLDRDGDGIGCDA
jgi:endonuclease YncB( thermonuclease family)